MKIKNLLNWKLGLALASLPFLAATLSRPGTLQAASQTVGADLSATVSDAATNAALTSQSFLTNSTGSVASPVPPGLTLYGGTAEIVKLAQAGMDKDVMMTYITNANVRFALTSDQIIYLNDLGVSGDVVTAMLQHDASQTTPAPAPAPASETAATEPATLTTPVTAPDQTAPEGYPSATQPMDYSDAANPPAYENPYNSVNPAVVASDAGYFYDSLAPYGNWINVAGYGPCWQPTVSVANRDWRPYGDRGRWLYSDNGWYWQSDYSWGWAAFHYGRWLRHDNAGWVWVPNKVWGPAWVSWRATRDYAGWAPLPPSAVYVPGVGLRFQNRSVSASFDFGLPSSLFTFIPTERLSDYYPVTYGVTRVATAGIFNQSVVVNNATEVNRQVVSAGIDPWRVIAAGGTPVRRALIREAQNDPDDRRFRTDRLDVRGNTLVIFRPQLPEATSRSAVATSTSTSQVHVNHIRHEDTRLSSPSAVPIPATAAYSTAMPGTFSPSAHTTSTILVPRVATVAVSSTSSAVIEDPRAGLRTPRLVSDGRQGSAPDAGFVFRSRAADSSSSVTLTPGSSYRTASSASAQSSGLALPRSQAAYGIEGSVPATSRSATSYGGSASSAAAVAPRYYSAPATYSAPAAASRSYSAPATYSAPASSSRSSSTASYSSSASSSSSSSSSSGRGR